MMTQAWKKSAGTLMSWWGTKNERIMSRPITAVMNSGNSRFTPALLLRRHPLGEPVDVGGLEQAAHDHDHDDGELDEVRALEAADQLGLARQVGAGGVQLLADQRVIAGHHEERQLVHVRGARDLDRPGREPRLGEQ